MAWRLPSEGISITTKGRKEGTGGRVANFFVAIAFDRGVVMCKHFPPQVTGENFAKLVTHCFPLAFQNCKKDISDGMFLQDGDPRQNSAIARIAWEELGAKMFSIPARSPDLNPIENIFHLVRKQLAKDAIENEIKSEGFNDFVKRVSKTIKSFPIATINSTIASMPKRLRHVVESKGGRTKY